MISFYENHCNDFLIWGIMAMDLQKCFIVAPGDHFDVFNRQNQSQTKRDKEDT